MQCGVNYSCAAHYKSPLGLVYFITGNLYLLTPLNSSFCFLIFLTQIHISECGNVYCLVINSASPSDAKCPHSWEKDDHFNTLTSTVLGIVSEKLCVNIFVEPVVQVTLFLFKSVIFKLVFRKGVCASHNKA